MFVKHPMSENWQCLAVANLCVRPVFLCLCH